jgi:predicted AAA+ superfamily ATPase
MALPENGAGLVERRVLPLVAARMASMPVVLMEGPRTVGKSTLMRRIADQEGATVFDLDDVDMARAVADDPMVVTRPEGLVCIDEYQRVPQVLDAIKSRLNRMPGPGQFLLAGSTRHAALPTGARALTGRLARVRVLPLSRAELAGARVAVLEALLAGDGEPLLAAPPSRTGRDDYADMVAAGGFPLAVAARSPLDRDEWFSDYIDLTLDRDVRELAALRQGAVLPELLNRLGGQIAQVFNASLAASSMGVTGQTVSAYVRLLENAFLVQLLPAWTPVTTSRTTMRPKVQFIDSGVAAHVCRQTEESLKGFTASSMTAFGHLLENFVAQEVIKQVGWQRGAHRIAHWRTSDGSEVDLVVETRGGNLFGVEVKSSANVSSHDMKGLRALRDRLGSRFLAGVVFHTGTIATNPDDRLYTAPIDTLWRNVPQSQVPA